MLKCIKPGPRCRWGDFLRLDFAKKSYIQLGEPGGIRTHDPKIKSLVLYQLSYGLAGAL